MKITSRTTDSDAVAGEGEFTIRMTFEQLQFVAAMAYNTRLGSEPYKEAAYQLINTTEELFGDGFAEDAYFAVDMHISIEDDSGTIIARFQAEDITIEV